MLVTVERNGPVRAAPVPNDSTDTMSPIVDRFVDKRAHLRTDELKAYKRIGEGYASDMLGNYQRKECARGDIHNNTAESFNAILERARQGVYHYLSNKHLSRYLHEIGFRWNQREPVLRKNEGSGETGNETIASHDNYQIVVDPCSRPPGSKIYQWGNLLRGDNVKRFNLILGNRSVFFCFIIFWVNQQIVGQFARAIPKNFYFKRFKRNIYSSS